MDLMDVPGRIAAAVDTVRTAGGLFGYLHGSQADGTARPGSDIDIAVFFGRRDLVASDILLPPGVDLLVLDTAPLELAGRIAAKGSPLFEANSAARVDWEASTRKIYFDEKPRFERSHREFLEAVRHG